jgi:hypothetical protein
VLDSVIGTNTALGDLVSLADAARQRVRQWRARGVEPARPDASPELLET